MYKQQIFIHQVLKTPDADQIAEQLNRLTVEQHCNLKTCKLISWGQDIQANKEEQEVCDEC